MHITEAEQWWLNNWKNKPETFPDFPATIGLAELSNRADAVAATRNQFLADLTDADLNRMVRVTPRPGREFPMAIGVSLLQICCHGTHHRAQVTNMLRHCGVTPPGLDHALRIREQFLARQNHTAATSRSKQSE